MSEGAGIVVSMWETVFAANTHYHFMRQNIEVSKAPPARRSARLGLGPRMPSIRAAGRADRGKDAGQGLGACGCLLYGPASESIAKTLHAMVDQEPPPPVLAFRRRDRSGPSGSEERARGHRPGPYRATPSKREWWRANQFGASDNARAMPGPVRHSRRTRAALASILNRIRACCAGCVISYTGARGQRWDKRTST
jgi:hypothetical protein